MTINKLKLNRKIYFSLYDIVNYHTSVECNSSHTNVFRLRVYLQLQVSEIEDLGFKFRQ